MPDSPIAKFLEKRGAGLHHVAHARCPTCTPRRERLQSAGARLLNEPRRGAGGHLTSSCTQPRPAAYYWN